MHAHHWTTDPSRLRVLCDQIETAHSGRLAIDRACLRAYYARAKDVQRGAVSSTANPLVDLDRVRAGGFSLVRQVVDTGLAMTVRQPAIKILPVGARFTVRRQSKILGRFVNGVFHVNRFGDKLYNVVRDGMNCTFGALKWYVNERKEIVCEPVDPLTLFWLEEEGRDPANLFQIYHLPRAAVLARIGDDMKARSLVASLPRSSPMTVEGVDVVRRGDGDTVRVDEAWSLPTDDHPGRHAITCGGAVLVDKPHELDVHSICVYRWFEGQCSFGGVSATSVLLPFNRRDKKLVRMADESVEGSIPRLLVQEDEDEDTALSDTSMQRIKWRRHKPEVILPQSLSREILEWRTTNKAEAFETIGVNTQFSRGTKDSGLVAKVAIREASDLASTRLVNQQAAISSFVRDCANVVVKLAEVTYTSKGARVTAPGTEMLEEIDFPVGLKENQYNVAVSEMNALPLTAPGRLDFVNDLAESELLEKDEIRGLLQIPDTEAALDRARKPRDLAERQVELALWEGRFLAPLPMQDLELLLKIARAEYMGAYVSETDFPAENLELLRRLIAEAELLLGQGKSAPAPAAPAPGAAAPELAPMDPAAEPPIEGDIPQ